MGTGISPTLNPSGSNDVAQISNALNTYQTVNLSTGHWLIYGEPVFKSGNTLLGAGPGTLLDFGPNYVGDLHTKDVSNIELGNFNIQGTPWYQGILIEASAQDISGFYIHDISANSLNGTCFTLNTGYGSKSISDVRFSRVNANTPSYMGFSHRGSGTLNNVRYYRCTTLNCGTQDTAVYGIPLASIPVWSVNFDGADDTLTVNGLYYIDCSANGAWESDWHFEGVATKKGVVFLDCNAQYAGLKPSTFDNLDGSKGVIYGAGFLFGNFTSGRDDLVANNLTATGGHNLIADVWDVNSNTKLFLSGSAYNKVFGRNATVTRVTGYGNCVGIDIYNTVAKTHDLILYSSDQTLVNGPTITLSDGKLVTISTFNDFVVLPGIVGSSGGTTYTASASVSPSASGTVSLSPAGPYNSGTTVTVNATPASGYAFLNMVINGTTYTSNNYSFAITQNTTIVVNFQSTGGGGSGSIGYNATGAVNSGMTKNNFFLNIPGFVGVAGATVNSMSALLSNTDTVAHNFSLAIYTLSGSTYTKVAETASTSIAAGVTKTLMQVNLLTPLVINASTTYYLAFNTDNSLVVLWCDAISGFNIYVAGNTFGTWPATFTAPGDDWNNHELGILANYTTGSGGFVHGTPKTANFKITIAPANQSCQLELWLGPNSSTKSASGGLSTAFNSTGAQQQVTSTLTLPAVGTYNVYVDIYLSGIKVTTFVGLSTVTIT